MRVGIETTKARFGILVRMRSLCPMSRMSATRSYCWQAMTYAGDAMNSSSITVSSAGFRRDHSQRVGLNRECHGRVARVLAVQLERRGAGSAAYQSFRLEVRHPAQIQEIG